MPKTEPTSLDDAIKAQAAVVNQLADEHAELHSQMAAKGEAVHKASNHLNALLQRRAAQ